MFLFLSRKYCFFSSIPRMHFMMKNTKYTSSGVHMSSAHFHRILYVAVIIRKASTFSKSGEEEEEDNK